MRIILILLTFLSSSFDPCMIEEFEHSIAVSASQSAIDDCNQSVANDEVCSSGGSTENHGNKHTSHDACQHCHGGHFGVPVTAFIPIRMPTSLDQVDGYAFDYVSPINSTLRRPPKLRA